MSRYLQPEDRSCFCCEPALSSAAYPQEMLNQQLQGWNVTSSSISSTQPFVVHAFTAATDGAELPQQDDSQHGWNHIRGSGTSRISHESEMCQDQDSEKIVLPVCHSAVRENETEDFSPWNLHVLRNREIGNKMLEVRRSNGSPLTPDFGGAGSMLDGGKTACIGSSNTNKANGMDLDSALDELGMLSTVTNSRRQYLVETKGQASQQRLYSKSKSSPNLTLCYPSGHSVLDFSKQNSECVGDTLPFPTSASSGLFDKSPHKSDFLHLGCNNLSVLENRSASHRSDPYLSRKHRHRYTYRQSKSPYKIPLRYHNSLQDSDFISEYFSSDDTSLKSSTFSSSTPSLEPSSDLQASGHTNCQQSVKSKSNTASPVKLNVEMRLTRSLSAEDLTSVSRRLEQEMNKKCRDSSSTEQGLDVMTSQMTDLHMS